MLHQSKQLQHQTSYILELNEIFLDVAVSNTAETYRGDDGALPNPGIYYIGLILSCQYFHKALNLSAVKIMLILSVNNTSQEFYISLSIT